MSLIAAIGRYPHTAELFARPDGLEMQPFPVISRAFAPMIRERRFDVSEMAIATWLQAVAYGTELVALPVALAARHQAAALLRRAADPFGPGDLRGRRVAVRAYSQTTGMWIRGILHEETGILPTEMRWTTFEDAHVAAYSDPLWAARAPAGADMLAMLRAGQVDAAIFGNDTPADADVATVYPDPAASGEAFVKRHGFIPVNHVVVVRPEVARDAGQVRALMDRFRGLHAAQPPEVQARLPIGRAALAPAMALASQYALAQGLLPRPVTPDEVWAGLPEGVD